MRQSYTNILLLLLLVSHLLVLLVAELELLLDAVPKSGSLNLNCFLMQFPNLSVSQMRSGSVNCGAAGGEGAGAAGRIRQSAALSH